MTNEIQWEDGAVCYAYGKQWLYQSSNYLIDHSSINPETVARDINGFTDIEDFQLNHIRNRDYIPASELDTEKKYNDVVEVFGLFGFPVFHQNKGFEGLSKVIGLAVNCKGNVLNGIVSCKRQLTYTQVMAIGKLKLIMDERNKRADGFEGDCGAGEDVVNSPSHYAFFDDVEAIEIIASSMTVEQFKGYCMGNKLKYRLRAGAKDDLQQDIDKSNKYSELFEQHKNLCKAS